MRLITLLLVLSSLLAACMPNEIAQEDVIAPSKENHDQDREEIVIKIEQKRQSEQPYVYLRGGYDDGTAVGQEVRLIVTDDDVLTCLFTGSPPGIVIINDNGEYHVIGGNSYHTSETLKVAGLYEKMATLLPTPKNQGFATEKTDNFIYERSLKRFADG